MVFLNKNFKYLKKSFLALAVAMLIPSVLMGIFVQPFSTLAFLPLYYVKPQYAFIDVFFMLVSKSALKRVYPYILIFVALTLCFSYALGIIEKHFKTGKLGIANPVRFINNSALSVLQTLPIMMVVLLIMCFLQAGLVTLVEFIFSSHIMVCIWITLISLAVFILLIMLTVVICVWAVVMQVYGYSFADAFVETMRTISKKWFSFVFGLFLPLFILCVPPIVINSLGITDKVITITVNSLTYLVAFVYSVAYVFVSVYELNGLMRRDEKSFY